MAEKRGAIELLCSTFVCGIEGQLNLAGRYLDANFRCNKRDDCINTKVDEQGMCDFEQHFQCTDSSQLQIDTRKVCDLKCDCWNCEDEGFCNNVTYGLYCDAGERGEFVPADDVCDKDFNQHCTLGDDENKCNADIVRTCQLYKSHLWYSNFNEGRRPIFQSQVCAVPRGEGVCSDGLDQVNCSDSTRVAMACTVDSFLTTISVFGICKNHFLCDDGYDSNCEQPEGGCIVHKNKLCDDFYDCPGHQDEENEVCQHLTTVFCTRRVSLEKKKLKKSRLIGYLTEYLIALTMRMKMKNTGKNAYLMK